MKTLTEVRRRFDELLFENAAAVEQIDAILCEDFRTVFFYAYMSDDEMFLVSLDLTAEAAAQFDPADYESALSSLCDWTVH